MGRWFDSSPGHGNKVMAGTQAPGRQRGGTEMRYEITKYDGNTNVTRVVATINDADAARMLADASNADRPLGSSDYYSVREEKA
jgi:hypothetical protein